MTEGCSGPVVGHDFQRLAEDATDDGAHAAVQPGQDDGAGQYLLESKIENPKSTRRCPQKRQTKPIWNRSKTWNRKSLSQKRPRRRGENKANSPRGRRPESRARA